MPQAHRQILPVLTIPPALAARMALTIDSISHGRFGINIVSGWRRAEYTQMASGPAPNITLAATNIAPNT